MASALWEKGRTVFFDRLGWGAYNSYIFIFASKNWVGAVALRGTCTARLPSGAVCWSAVTFYSQWLLCCVRLEFPFYFEVRVPAVSGFGVSRSVSAVVESWRVPPVSCRPDHFSPAPRPSSLWASVPAFRGLWIEEAADWNSTLCLAPRTCPALCTFRIKTWGWNKPNERSFS